MAPQLTIGNFNSNSLPNATKLSPQPKAIPSETEDSDWSKPIKNVDESIGRTAAQEITKLVEKHYHSFGGWNNAFDTILDVILYALLQQEEEYLKLVKTLKKEALDCCVKIYAILFKSLYYDCCMYDVLGMVYMKVASISKSKAFGQFFTPSHVCEMMASMSLGDIKQQIQEAKNKDKRIKICDPCVGSGAMLLGAKKAIIAEAGLAGLDYFEFYGQDIDKTCVTMCKIQMILTDYRYMANLLISTAFDIRNKVEKE